MASSSSRLDPWGILMPCLSAHSLIQLSLHKSKTPLLTLSFVARADAAAESAAPCNWREVRYALRRTDAMSLARVVGSVTGCPCSFNQALSSKADQVS